MKINNQPKAQMHAARDFVDTDVLTPPLSPSVDSEVVSIAKRRNITHADKRRIVLATGQLHLPLRLKTQQ